MFTEDFPESVEQLQQRSLTPGQAFLRFCDGKLTDEDLGEEGNAFAKDYYDPAKGSYLSDYEATLAKDWQNFYRVEDTWENYDKLRPILAQRFQEWKQRQG